MPGDRAMARSFGVKHLTKGFRIQPRPCTIALSKVGGSLSQLGGHMAS